MNRDIKKFITSFIVVASLLAIADFCIGTFLMFSLNKMPQTQSQASRANYALLNTEADCIIVGPSRASEHYDSEIISDILGISTYNAGRDGHYIVYDDCVLHTILDRTTPQIVIFDGGDGMMCTSDHVTANSLKPYYGRFDYITRRLDDVNPRYFKYQMISKLYRFNNMPIRIIEGYLKPKDVFNGYCSRGNVFIQDEPYTSVRFEKSSTQEIDVNGEKAMDDMISICNEKGIELFIVQSPMYTDVYTDNPIIEEKIKNYGNIHVINDLALIEFSSHPELFSDHVHLNDKGAKKFSTLVSGQIMTILHAQ